MFERIPRILYRSTLGELAVSFLMSLGSLSLIFAIVTGIQGVQAGFQVTVILPWVLWSLVYSLYYTVPIALLVATTLTYGRIAADREYTAMCASGISPLHVYGPVGILSGLIMVLAFGTQGWLLPEAHYAQRNIARYVLKQLEQLGDGKQGYLELPDGYVSWDENRGRILRGVTIRMLISLKELEKANPTYAASVEIDPEDDEAATNDEQLMPMFLRAGTAEVGVDEEDKHVELRLTEVQLLLGNPVESLSFAPEWPRDFENLQATRSKLAVPLDEQDKREGDMSTAELHAYHARCAERLAALRAEEPETVQGKQPEELARLERRLAKRLRKVDLELWERRNLALSCFTFAFIGFPVSLSLRYRHRLASLFAGGALVICVYYPLLLLGRTLTEAGTLPGWAACSIGNVLLLLIGAGMTGRLLLR